jgi:hypothetical protein
MKKIFFTLIMVLAMAGFVSAADPITLLSAVTSTGDGTEVDIYTTRTGVDKSAWAANFTCTVTLAGTAPTSVIVAVKGGIVTGTAHASLATHTYTVATVDTKTFHVTSKGIRYITGNFTSKVGGDGTTAVTLRCAPWKAGD